MKKLNVHAPPRRAVPPPYRPATRGNLILSDHTRVHTRSSTKKKKCPFFKHHNSSFFNRKLFTDFEWFLRSFNISPIFEYWIFELRSIFRSKTGCDMVPSKFSKKWFSLERNCTWREKVQLPSSGNQLFENSLGNLSQPWFDDGIEVSAKFQYPR